LDARVKSGGFKVVVLTLKKMASLLAPLFNLGVDFKVFLDNIMTLLRTFVKCGNFNPSKKGVIPFFETWVDFGVFIQKYRFLWLKFPF